MKNVQLFYNKIWFKELKKFLNTILEILNIKNKVIEMCNTVSIISNITGMFVVLSSQLPHFTSSWPQPCEIGTTVAHQI